jgi:NAD+ diphosphatase
MPKFKYCPICATPLVIQSTDDHERLMCPQGDYIHYDNPKPVVAAIIEYENEVLLARNTAWPPTWFALITGFMEKGESPEQAVLREMKEEIGLEGEIVSFVGLYPFFMRNELIIAYHVKASGTIQLNEEIAEVKKIPKQKLIPWQYATGDAVRDWLKGQGILDNIDKTLAL